MICSSVSVDSTMIANDSIGNIVNKIDSSEAKIYTNIWIIYDI